MPITINDPTPGYDETKKKKGGTIRRIRDPGPSKVPREPKYDSYLTDSTFDPGPMDVPPEYGADIVTAWTRDPSALGQPIRSEGSDASAIGEASEPDQPGLARD